MMRYLWMFLAAAILTAGAFVFGSHYLNNAVAEKDKPSYADEPDLPAELKDGVNKEEFMHRRDEYFALLRGIEDDLPFDPQNRIDAVRRLEVQESQRSAKTPEESALLAGWTNIGPAPIPNGQTQGISTAVAGRTVTIAVNPTNPDIVYVGAAQGGLYRSTNGGAAWTPLTDNALSLSSGVVVHVPISPAEPDTVLYGTGEAGFSADSYFGVGIYRIRNASSANPSLEGPINKGIGGNDVFTGSSISEILVNPADPNIIFVSTLSGVGGIGPASAAVVPSRGVYRSTNALSANPTFEKLTVSTADGGDRQVSDLVADPDDFNRLIVAVVDRIGCPQPRNQDGTCPVATAQLLDGGFYVSTNALSVNPTFTRTFTAGANVSDSRGELAVHKNPTSGLLTIYGASGFAGGTVQRSIDGGQTWTQRIDNNFCTAQCFYDMAINVDPRNADRVYLAGSPTLAFGFSTNGGTSFTTSDLGLHVDSHVIAFAPSNPDILYFGSDGGIYRSNNAGGTWNVLNNSTYSATQFVSLAVHPIDPKYTIGGTQDNGTNFYRPDGTWEHIQDGDGGYTVIDSNSVNTEVTTLYHTFFNARQADITVPNTGAQIVYEYAPSTTAAQSGGWVFRGCRLGVPGNGILCTDGTLFYAPLELGPGVPINPVYFGTDRLYRSANNGLTNIAVSQVPLEQTSVLPQPPSGTPLSAIGIAPQDDNIRLVGLRLGGLWGTTLGLPTMTNLDPTNTIPNRFVSRVTVDPVNRNIAYVTLSTFGVPTVWKTTNLNNLDNLTAPTAPTWTPAMGSGTSTLPPVPVSAFLIDPTDPNRLYAGTDIGVYTSFNGGANWTPFGTGLPRIAVFDMALTSNRLLRIATHGRGLWEIQAISPTAAGVLVSGKITDARGRGVSGATVELVEPSGNSRRAATDLSGNYRFEDVAAGQTYTFSVFSKRQRFESRVVTINEAMENLDFAPAGTK